MIEFSESARERYLQILKRYPGEARGCTARADFGSA
jgi:hypothetical protein